MTRFLLELVFRVSYGLLREEMLQVLVPLGEWLGRQHAIFSQELSAQDALPSECTGLPQLLSIIIFA